MDDNVAAGLRAMGVSEEDIEAAQHQAEAVPEEPVDFEVHEDNWDSVMLFQSVQTQWIWASNGLGARRVGLSNVCIESTLRMTLKPRRQWPTLLADVQLMERGVLAVDAETIGG